MGFSSLKFHQVNAEALFPCDDEIQLREPEKRSRKGNKRLPRHARCWHRVGTSRASPARMCSQSSSWGKKKPVIKPIAPKTATVHDIFGSVEEPSAPGKPIPQLQSYISRRLANGHSRQTFNCKHYVELKVYSCDEIEKVQL